MLLVIFGILAIIFPGLARFINFPGSERIKAIAVIVTGFVFMVLGYRIEVS